MKRLIALMLALVLTLSLLTAAWAEGLESVPAPVDAPVEAIEIDLIASNDGEEPEEPEATGLPIDATHFPDAEFRAMVAATYDTDGDNQLSDEELEAVDGIGVSNSGVASLKGIEYFENLQWLNCDGNPLTELDLSANPDIESVICNDCPLTKLNLQGCKSLETLWCGNTKLTSLDLSGCESLERVGCGPAPLTSLTLEGCESLQLLDCSETQLTSLDLSGCEEMISLCSNLCRKLAHVNLDGADNLVSFVAMECAMESLELGEKNELRFLFTIGTPVKTVDISACPKLLDVVKNNKAESDGANIWFGEVTTYATEGIEYTGYPINVKGTTHITAEGKTVYEPKFALEQTGIVEVTIGKKTTLNPLYTPEGLVFMGATTWTTSNKKIATVTDKGVVKGLSKGTAVITAKSPWGATASVKVKVNPPLPSKVKLDKKGTVQLKVGKALQLKATLYPAKAESKLTWSSNKPTIAKVSTKGKVKALKPGLATITVTTENGKRAKVKIRVKAK